MVEEEEGPEVGAEVVGEESEECCGGSVVVAAVLNDLCSRGGLVCQHYLALVNYQSLTKILQSSLPTHVFLASLVMPKENCYVLLILTRLVG